MLVVTELEGHLWRDLLTRLSALGQLVEVVVARVSDHHVGKLPAVDRPGEALVVMDVAREHEFRGSAGRAECRVQRLAHPL